MPAATGHRPQTASSDPQYGVISLLGGIFQGGRDVILFKIGIILENGLPWDASREQIQNIPDPDPESPSCRAFRRTEGD